MKRGCSVTDYLRWSDLEGVDPFPFKETLVYHYVEQLRSDGAPATKASSFLEAVQFIRVLLGMEGTPLDMIQSARLQGATLASFDRKRIIVKAPPFTVHAVRLLEKGVTELAARVQRVVAGDACFLIHGRLRCDDAARVTLEPTLDLDENGKGYVETTAIGGDAKIGASRRKRPFGLPFVADANGLSGSWAEEWVSLRREEGFDAAKDGALFLAVNGAGLFTKAKRSTSAVTELAREVLVSAGVPVDECRYTSHSGKATCRSWAAKFGLNHGCRRLLGGHAKPKDLSVLEYSRDCLGPAVIELQKILDSINSRRYEPDITRAGRFRVPNNLVKEIEVDTGPISEAPSALDPPGYLSSSASSSGTSPASGEAMTEEEFADAVHAGWKRAAAVGLTDNEILARERAVDEGRVHTRSG